jgi:2-polyprenyl-3-methyl-5-hydroxy-6-metoxy-1,4-benzoquinol methylase
MKSYYYAHESAYKRIKEKGYVGWDNAKTLEELGDPKTQDYLKSSIAKWLGHPMGKKALDLGCGTGSSAFMIARHGLLVTGIDISETAISMANELGLKQNLQINFLVGDVLSLDQLDEKFDLIYDSHCFHCIVFDEDRRKVLMAVKNSLNKEGIFILDTMAMSESYDPIDSMETLRFDNEYILWHKISHSNYRGIVEVNGQKWCAQRRVYPSHKIIDEVNQAGFKILSKSIEPQGDGWPLMLRLILGH